jgi:hypothetical protein
MPERIVVGQVYQIIQNGRRSWPVGRTNIGDAHNSA